MTTTVCEEYGVQAVGGECPVHKGDACLFDVSQMRDIMNENAEIRTLLDSALTRLNYWSSLIDFNDRDPESEYERELLDSRDLADKITTRSN